MARSLRSLIPNDEFDYQTLISALDGYKRPRDRITKLMRQETIIRIKKGLYIFGDEFRRGPVQKEILANLIHGPSYISLEYALGYHGMIPERVTTVTSITCGRSKEFTTPIGRFSYQAIPLPAYCMGYNRADAEPERFLLLAGPEKALADKVYVDRTPLRTQKDLQAYLIEGLRIDEQVLRDMNADLLEDYAVRYRSHKIHLLMSIVARLQRLKGGRDRA